MSERSYDRQTVINVLKEAQELFCGDAGLPDWHKERHRGSDYHVGFFLDLLFKRFDVNVDDPDGPDGFR